MRFKKLMLLVLVPLVLLHTNGMVLHIHQCVKHICAKACGDSEGGKKTSCCKTESAEEESGCCKNEKKYVKADNAQVVDGEKKFNLEKIHYLPFLVTTYTIICYQSTSISTHSNSIKQLISPFGSPSEYRSVIQVWNC